MNFNLLNIHLEPRNFDCTIAMAKRVDVMDKIISIYKTFKGVHGVFLSGTKAGVPRDVYSDLDFLVVVDDTFNPATQIQELHDLLNVSKDKIHTYCDDSYEYGVSTDFYCDNIEVCVMHYKKKDLESRIVSYYNGNYFKTGYFYPGALIAALSENYILYEQGSALKQLQQIANKYPDNAVKIICNRELGWSNYFIKKFEQFLYRKDINNLQVIFANIIDCGLNMLYAIHKKPYAGPTKALSVQFNIFSHDCPNLEKVVSIILTGTDSNTKIYTHQERADMAISFLKTCQKLLKSQGE